jgi:hypothetical protein
MDFFLVIWSGYPFSSSEFYINYTITGWVKCIPWIEGFFNKRDTDLQYVIIEDEKSTYEYVPLETGVPQGSIWWPSLFLYYINYIRVCLTSTYNYLQTTPLHTWL